MIYIFSNKNRCKSFFALIYSVTYTFLVFPFTQKTKNLLFFSFSVKISIFVSVLKVKQSNALKLAPLPNRYQLPGLSLFTLYQSAD